MRANFDARRSNTYNLFSIPDFSAFLSSAFQTGDSPNAWVSVEPIHNQIHASFGGSNARSGPHVIRRLLTPRSTRYSACSTPTSTAFTATYQAAHVTPQPTTRFFGRRVQEGDTDDINTPLWPFRKASGSYSTARGASSASSIWDFGCAYQR